MLSGGFRFALPTLRSAMTKEKRKRNADRRVHPTSASRDAARTSGCARLSAFHHGSYRQGFRPLGATPGQASWDAAGRSIRQARSNRGAKTSRSYTGVTRARLSQSRERTSRTGRSAGQHDARSCPRAARSCPKLPEAARSCPKLPEAARSCPKLPEAARSCPKLPGCGVYRSARGHRTRSTSRNTFATGVLGERDCVPSCSSNED